MNQNTILKVLCGSQAHGLASPESDFDWRGVFVTPTQELLKIGGHINQTSWIEGKEDDTSWEVGKFLLMATKCNPTVLEVFKAPTIEESTPHSIAVGKQETNYLGKELQSLFPYVWNSTDVLNAFVGYGLNQRKKFLDNKDVRPHKYAVAYLRTLYQARELLSTGDFHVNMRGTEVYDILLRWKNKQFECGEVIQLTREWEDKVKIAYESSPKHIADIDKVNEYLLKIRKSFWSA